MKNIIAIALGLFCIPVIATNIKVCNQADGQIRANIYPGTFLGLKICDPHEGLIEVGQCSDWNVHGCNTTVEVWFPNHTHSVFNTSSDTSSCSVTAIKQGQNYRLTNASGTAHDSSLYYSE